MGDPVIHIEAIGDFSMPLTLETRLYWAASRAVHAPDNRRNAAAAHQGIRLLQRLAFHAANIRIRRSAVDALRAAERIDNRAVRRAVRAALLLKRLAESSARN